MRLRVLTMKRIGLSARSASPRYSIRRPFHSPGPVLPVTDLRKSQLAGLLPGYSYSGSAIFTAFGIRVSCYPTLAAKLQAAASSTSHRMTSESLP
jgi:hypothetical protein